MTRLSRALTFLAAIALFGGCESSEDPFLSDDGGDTPSRDTGTGSTDTGADTGVSADTGAGDVANDSISVGSCGEGVVFSGQAFVGSDPDPLSPNGGAPRFEPWETSYDAGIGALLDVAPAPGSDPLEGEWTVSGATVIATDYNSETTQRAQRSFWLADGTGSIAVFFYADDPDSQPGFSVKVGQRISGTVTSVGNFNGVRQISTADGSSWTLDSEDNEVYIRDVSEGPVTVDDVNGVVRVTGVLATLDNPDCGGSQCYTLAYNDGETITFRSGSQFISVGQCITFVGPVRLFSGEPQLDTLNFDWLWTYDAD